MRSWIGAGVLVVLLSGCQPAENPYPPRTPTPGKARLPPVPELHPAAVPTKHPDGAWSVQGVMSADREDRTGELRVHGTIAALEVCAMKDKACNPAPHLYLTDSTEGLGRRLLVGGERDLGTRGWKVGDRVTLTGHFATASADGLYFAPQGLLLLSPLPAPDAAVAAPTADTAP
jgi:hypothetical protein